ncbi:hypothetical protein VKT23_012987 [Stygiomarasmius scandens]|uniref:Ubinuclein middle domain-containing protein n=1 Tax=Marasmiellus scandens TaxID=2682957 RepID=A0ABR1J7J7_9AGAR
MYDSAASPAPASLTTRIHSGSPSQMSQTLIPAMPTPSSTKHSIHALVHPDPEHERTPTPNTTGTRDTEALKPILLPTLPSNLDGNEDGRTSPAPPSPTVSSSTKTISKAATTKPKSKVSKPSPSPAPSRPPLQTIRLRITLGGPDNYEVDVAKMTRDTGQMAISPLPTPKFGLGDESSGSDEDDEDDGGSKGAEKTNSKPGATETSILGAAMAAYEQGTALPDFESSLPGTGQPPKKKRKVHKPDSYDTSDPFIDDSELAVDERKFFAQTKQTGFYVSQGEVALLRDRSSSAKKSKPKSQISTIISAASTSASASTARVNSQPDVSTFRSEEASASALGTKDSPIALYSDAESDHDHNSRPNHHPNNHHSREPSNHAPTASNDDSGDSSISTALKSPNSGSKKRTILVQGSRDDGVFPSEGSYPSLSPSRTQSQGQGQGQPQPQIYWRFSLANPLLGLGEERVKQGVGADPASMRKLAWGDRPEMRFVLDDGSGGANAEDDSDPEGNAESRRRHSSSSGVIIVGGGADSRERYTTVLENGKKKKVVDVSSFHPALHPLFEKLKAAITAENWDVKGRFPPSLKPILADVALTAIKLDEYDDHFFSLMPTLFIYNKFTMTKLIKRTVFAEHIAMLVERQEALLTQLKKDADEGFSRAEEEWEKSVVAWDKRQKKAKANDTLSVPGNEIESHKRSPSDDPDPDHEHEDEDTVMQTEDVSSGKDGAKGAKGKEKEKAEQPPAKRYRMTESMKAIVWELVLLSNECCRLENEKNSLEGSVMQISEQSLRKALYQKIVSCFPAGWMNSGHISRDVSAIKKRLEKELEEG